MNVCTNYDEDFGTIELQKEDGVTNLWIYDDVDEILVKNINLDDLKKAIENIK